MNETAKHWHKNIEILTKSQPKLAYQLDMCNPTDIEFCWTTQAELNLKRSYQDETYYYHSPNGAIDEAWQWMSNLPIGQSTVLYIYGVGLGYYYDAAKDWLHANPQHALVFLEEDLAVLHRLLETEQGTQLLQDPQVQLVHFTALMADQPVFDELSWTYLLCPFTFSALKLYEQVNPEGCSQLAHQIAYDAAQKQALVDEYLQYGVVFFRNFYPNLFELPKAYLGNALFEQFPGVPAIICGAGPSLKKNLDILKTLKDHALIFGGGSALNALLAHHFVPHFGAGIDPNQAQYERLKATCSQALPFFYRSRLFHDALKLVQGPRLYLTGTGGYDTADWFEEQLGIQGENLDEGHNIVNFCVQIAHALGCNPIILVGVDLAFTDQQLYVEGVVEQSQWNQQTANDEQPLIQKDIYGQPVHTLWKWVAESEWIVEFAKNHPETSFINATEGGIGFDGIPNLPLAQVKQELLSPIEKLAEKISSIIQAHALSSISTHHIQDLMLTLKNSLEQCVQLFDKMMNELNQLVQNLQTGGTIPDSLETPNLTLAELDLEEQIGYQYVLNVFNLIYTRVKNRAIQEVQNSRDSLSPEEVKRKKINLQTERLNFLKDVARVNIELIQRAIKNQT